MPHEGNQPGSPEDWLRHAHSDLELSRVSPPPRVLLEGLCFHAQQAAEKALKAVYIQEFGVLRKVHDLAYLAKKLNTPDEFIDYCIRLSRVYTETRYPDASGTIPAKKFSEKDAQSFVEISSKVLKWLKKKLLKN